MEITSEEMYEEALRRVEEIFLAPVDSEEGRELNVLVNAIEEYEELHYPIAAPTEEEALAFRLEQELGL